MSLIQEIHSQKPIVRYSMFAFSALIVISLIGFFWFRSVQESVFMAMHSDPQERQDFLAQRDQAVPHPLVALGRGVKSLTASIGGLFGLDNSKGFDRPAQQDKVYLLPLSK